MRDINYWMDKRLRDQLQDIRSQAQENEVERVAIAGAQERPSNIPKEGLCIPIHQGEAKVERVCERECASSLLIPPLQVGILHKQRESHLITVLGLVLAMLISLQMVGGKMGMHAAFHKASHPGPNRNHGASIGVTFIHR